MRDIDIKLNCEPFLLGRASIEALTVRYCRRYALYPHHRDKHEWVIYLSLSQSIQLYCKHISFCIDKPLKPKTLNQVPVQHDSFRSALEA